MCSRGGESRVSGIYSGKHNNHRPIFRNRNACLNWLCLSLATWTQRPHFFLSKKQVGTWKVCSMSWKGSGELCSGLQPALKSEPSEVSGLVDSLPPFLFPVCPALLQNTWVSGWRSPCPCEKTCSLYVFLMSFTRKSSKQKPNLKSNFPMIIFHLVFIELGAM